MTMEDIVTFDIANKLKEKGFREKCLYRYSPYSKTLQPNIVDVAFPREVGLSEFYKCYNVYEDNDIDAPTISQVLKWLRGKDIMVEIPPVLCDDGTWSFSFRVQTKEFYDRSMKEDYTSYESAALACTEHVLDNLM